MSESLEEIALRTAIFLGHMQHRLKTKDSLGRILLGSNDSYYKEECFLYLYQTNYPEYRKFGISNNPEKRAITAKKYNQDLYKELLFSFKCKDRITACAIEHGLIQRPENLTVFASHHLSIREKDKRYVHLESKAIDFFQRRGIHNTELTTMSKKEVQEIVLMLFDDWENLSKLQFFNKHAPEDMDKLNGQIDGLLNKTIVVVNRANSLLLTGKSNYEKFNPEKQEFEPLVYPWKFDVKGDKYVPLKDVPNTYKKIYKKEMI
tara:strand:- start:126 stop:911 length:786 start_codon:yes stop_codon:yes gene_type:complete